MKPYPTRPMFSFLFIPDLPDPPDLYRGGGNSGVPAVRAPDRDHQAQDVGPRLRLRHRRVREHAAVPADVIERTRRLTGFVAQPEAGVTNDVELAVRIRGQAVTSRLVVPAP